MSADDDPIEREIPLEKRHGDEALRFRHWRERRGGGSWDQFAHENRMREIASRPARPLTDEERSRAFRNEHDHGDLSESERAQLANGIRPLITPARFLRRYRAIAGMVVVQLGIALIMWSDHDTLGAFGVALGIVGTVVGLVLDVRARRPRAR